jgi:Holliday junction resolvasome RuvABC endonuclease subunit
VTAPAPRFTVGFDIASKCGWAVLDSATGERIQSGTWVCSIRRGEGHGMRALRLRRLVADLHAELTAQLKPGEWIQWAYEEVKRHVATYAAQVHGELLGAVLGELESLGESAYVGVGVGEIKKHATGKGNASKTAMIAAARERWSLDSVGEDEADALWCAEAARLELVAGVSA